MSGLLCAVDVGTASARAGILDRHGHLLARAEHPIAVRRTESGFVEHASENIWTAVCAAVRAARGAADIPSDAVAGISFDATCSLVVRDREGRPLPVSAGDSAGWDTIAWLDHRAIAEAEECTATGSGALDFLGGAMSPEMQTPKLMWLKRHMPDTWRRTGLLFDLADFLTWRASGSLARSQSTLVAKWAYLAHGEGWQTAFFDRVGLSDLLDRGNLPRRATPAGSDLGPLTQAAASALGLGEACRVGAGFIDAFAATLGVLGAWADDDEVLDRHLGLIAGTSSCLMMLSRQPRRLAGGWGPYYGAALPDRWMTEGGQSATGALLDHIVRSHGAGGDPTAALHRRIVERIGTLRAAIADDEAGDIAPRLHVLPDFHGNRTPLADPRALGVIGGLTLDHSFDGLCRLYWRTAVGIALGVRDIVEAIRAAGTAVDTLHVSGGHTKNPLMMELYADATGCTLVEPVVDEAVLRGTAMAAATAAGVHPSLAAAAVAMRGETRIRRPDPRASKRFERDYRIFLEMQRQRSRLESL